MVGVIRVAVASLIAVATQAASAPACSVSPLPAATVYGAASVVVRGHRPWVRLLNVKASAAVTMRTVAVTCAAEAICAGGTSVAVERSGAFLRPKQPLASGARVQLVQGKSLLADFVVTADDPAPALPAWAGTDGATGGRIAEGLCNPPGTLITVPIKRTQANLDDAVALVYFTRPDAKAPHRKLAAIYRLGHEPEISLRNNQGETWMPRTLPARVWIALADNDGHVGPAVVHTVGRAPAPSLMRVR